MNALKHVDLYGYDSFRLPSEWKFPHKFKNIALSSLSIRNTNIKYLNNIPDTIERMRISHAMSITEISEFPASLKVLDVYWCGLTDLSMSILKCESLTSIKLIDCKNLINIPDYICKLNNLSELTVSLNLSELPHEIGRLSMLNTLNLSWCKQLTALPDSICDCPLSSLIIDYCYGLKYLPDGIGYLPNLKMSMKDCYSIEDIPCSLVSLMGNPSNNDFKFKLGVVTSDRITYSMDTMNRLPDKVVKGGAKSIFCYMRPKEYMRRWMMYVLCTRKLKKMRLPPEIIQIICNEYMGLNVECY